jgi:hypothetical protein
MRTIVKQRRVERAGLLDLSDARHRRVLGLQASRFATTLDPASLFLLLVVTVTGRNGKAPGAPPRR